MATDILFPQPVPTSPFNSFNPSTTSQSSPSFTNNPHKRKLSSISSSIPPELVAMAVNAPQNVAFDPHRHLNHIPPKKIYSMQEIGRGNQGVSPNAVSVPFPLFTDEAVKQMRGEILSKSVLENCQYSSNLAHCQLRGMAPQYAPFIYDAWHSPEVLSIVSKIAGIDLVPVMDFEIGHINVSINSEEDQMKAALAIKEHQIRQDDEGVAGCPAEDDAPVVDWHTDSYPFVCVLMLSDCSKMIGGETALRTGNGGIMKVRGPGMGNAVVLQGRYIEHQALRGIGGPERITMVTSFRPKNPLVKDDTVLTTVRPISDLSQLYGGYAEYRLEMLEERVRDQLKKLRDQKKANRRFDTVAFKQFIATQKDFLDSMLTQMVDDDKVVAGLADDTHLHSEDLRAANNKKTKKYMGEEVRRR